MTIEEKINRIHNIPKLIAELKSDRDRLVSVGAISYDKDKGSHGTHGNNAESSNIRYADYGNRIDSLILERTQLVEEVQADINSAIPGEDRDSIDKREIVKHHLIGVSNNKADNEAKKEKPLVKLTLKYIATKIVFRDYKQVRGLYKEACEQLEISYPNPLQTTENHLQ